MRVSKTQSGNNLLWENFYLFIYFLPWENEQSRPYVKGREVWFSAQQLDFQQKDLCESSRAWQGGLKCRQLRRPRLSGPWRGAGFQQS